MRRTGKLTGKRKGQTAEPLDQDENDIDGIGVNTAEDGEPEMEELVPQEKVDNPDEKLPEEIEEPEPDTAVDGEEDEEGEGDEVTRCVCQLEGRCI